MYRVLEGKKELAAAHKRMRASIQSGQPIEAYIGYQGGSFGPVDVYWFPSYGFWGFPGRSDAGDRAWYGFGIQDPTTFKGTLDIAVEINPLFDGGGGRDRNVKGLFLEGEDGTVYLGHRGNGVNRVPKDKFRKEFRPGPRGMWVKAFDHKGEVEVILLHPIHDPGLLGAAGAFAFEVDRIKKGAPAPKVPKGQTFNPEYHGPLEWTSSGDPVTFTRRHGAVANGLEREVRKRLEKAGGKVSTSNVPQDLLVRRPASRPILFECKTTASRQDVFTGLGQLSIYPLELGLDDPVRVLVLPDDDQTSAFEPLIGKLGVKIVRFTLKDETAHFQGLGALLGHEKKQ